MSAMLKNLQGQASKVQKLVSTHGTAAYKQLLERNKQYIVDGGDIGKANELTKQALFTHLASVPKRIEGATKEVETLRELWAKRGELTVGDVGVGALFVAEVYAWFVVGEIVGRGFTLTGYKV